MMYWNLLMCPIHCTLYFDKISHKSNAYTTANMTSCWELILPNGKAWNMV